MNIPYTQNAIITSISIDQSVNQIKPCSTQHVASKAQFVGAWKGLSMWQKPTGKVQSSVYSKRN